MELRTIVLSGKWGRYKAGEEIQVDAIRAEALVEAGLVVPGGKKRKTKTFRVASESNG